MRCTTEQLLAVQTVELAELIEAVDRTRNGVNGGAVGPLGQGLRRKFRETLIDALSSSSRARTLPVSGG